MHTIGLAYETAWVYYINASHLGHMRSEIDKSMGTMSIIVYQFFEFLADVAQRSGLWNSEAPK